MHPSSAVTNLPSTRSFTNPLLVEKTHELGKKSQASNIQVHHTYDVAKTEEILVKKKFITFPHDHQLPNKEELRKNIYWQYHNS